MGQEVEEIYIKVRRSAKDGYTCSQSLWVLGPFIDQAIRGEEHVMDSIKRMRKSVKKEYEEGKK